MIYDCYGFIKVVQVLTEKIYGTSCIVAPIKNDNTRRCHFPFDRNWQAETQTKPTTSEGKCLMFQEPSIMIMIRLYESVDVRVNSFLYLYH